MENENGYTHREILVIISVLLLSILLAALDQTIVSTALPTIAGALNGFDQISWLVTAYLLAQTVAMPLYGKLGDLYGRKPMLMYAVSIFLVGSLLAGMSTSMWMLIVFRAVQGLGAGGLMVTAFSVIADVIPARDRGKYLAFMMPVFGLATVFGPTMGGFFIDHFSWRWIFYINIPIGVTALVATWLRLRIPPPPKAEHKIDYLGAGLLATLMSAVVLIATWGGGTYAWNSFTIWVLGSTAVAALIAFIVVERRAHDPIFPLTLFQNRVVITCMLLGITVGLAMFGSLTYLPTFLQIAQGASATDSGLLMLPLSLGLFAAAITTGQLISRTGHYRSFPILGTVSATVGMYLLSTISAETHIFIIDVYMFILGTGIGMVMPVLTQVAQNAAPQDMIGVATSGVNLSRQLSGAIGVSIAGTLFTTRLHERLAAHLSNSDLALLGASGGRIDPTTIAQLPASLQNMVVHTFGVVLPSVFLDFVPILAMGIIIALSLPGIRLATTTRARAS